jgi:lysyl-tRNA synthetase class 1
MQVAGNPGAISSHWADATAARVVECARPAVISTGISPSGEIHIGNMREVLTGDAVYRALLELGAPARANYVADNFDPLRRVYPFLDRGKYEPLIGRPLSEIPCPCDAHDSYSEHFLAPFLEALERLAVRVEVERADQMYKSGRMTPYVVRALEQRDRIASILHEETGKQVAADWSPFNPLCADCGRMTQAKVRGFSARAETVDYECECGSRGTLPMAGGGKLVWRVDWPARWMLLGVSVEPFGKDHATRGGSYDTGVRLVREIFEGQPPVPIPYEWIRLRGRGDMSSSRGNVLSISRVLEVVPAEALRYLVIRERPQKTISFDPGLPLLRLVDEIDDPSTTGRDERALELSRAGVFQTVGVPFKHLVVVAQAARFDPQQALEILRRTGYPEVSADAVIDRMGYARAWLDAFAPEDLRFVVQPTLPPETAELSQEQRRFLARLARGLSSDMQGQAIHELIYKLAGECRGARPADLFRAIYLALLGKPRGPRAGSFLAVIGADFSAQRFKEAAGDSS